MSDMRACMRVPENHGYGQCGVRGCKPMYVCVRVCIWQVIMKCAYPVMFCMVNAVCAGVFREVP